MWHLNQLVRLQEIDPELVNEALEDLLGRNQELREKLVIGAYLNEEINLGKAAELLNRHPLELQQQFLERGIPIRIGVESKEALMAEIASAKAIHENP